MAHAAADRVLDSETVTAPRGGTMGDIDAMAVALNGMAARRSPSPPG